MIFIFSKYRRSWSSTAWCPNCSVSRSVIFGQSSSVRGHKHWNLFLTIIRALIYKAKLFEAAESNLSELLESQAPSFANWNRLTCTCRSGWGFQHAFFPKVQHSPALFGSDRAFEVYPIQSFPSAWVFYRMVHCLKISMVFYQEGAIGSTILAIFRVIVRGLDIDFNLKSEYAVGWEVSCIQEKACLPTSYLWTSPKWTPTLFFIATRIYLPLKS